MNKIEEVDFSQQEKGTFLKISLEALGHGKNKASSFLEQQKKKVGTYYLRYVLRLLEEEKKKKMTSSKVVIADPRRKDESFCALLEEMEVGAFRSCLQKPRGVIFEGLVTRFGYGVGGERKKKKKKK